MRTDVVSISEGFTNSKRQGSFSRTYRSVQLKNSNQSTTSTNWGNLEEGPYPPIPIVKALSFQFLPLKSGRSRSVNLPAREEKKKAK